MSDAASRLNVTPRTLTYYEELGLVTPARSKGRYRLYEPADLERFVRILRMRSLGFSLTPITELLKLRSVRRALRELRPALARARLSRLAWFYVAGIGQRQ